jgi:predicted MPP superfamily phosphohydrolase
VKPNSKLLTRRSFLGAFGLATVSGIGGAGYARCIEPQWLGVGRQEVRLGQAAGRAPLKILHLSDLHASGVVSLDFIQQAVALGLSLKPDLICLTGDFITHKFERFAEYARVLAPLAQAAPTFACLGNHDGGMWAGRRRGYADTTAVRELLQASGVELLHNDVRPLRVGDWNLRLVGLGDLWAKEIQPVMAFSQTPGTAAATTVLLSHNPDSKDQLTEFAWDLMLCGHTHGGQLKLPFVGTPFAPVRDLRFVEGLHRWESRWIHVTRGVGNLHGVRFNCPPEVSLLTLV